MATKNGAVAKRYSRALWMLLAKTEESDAWVEQLKTLEGAFKNSKEFQALMSSPAFPYEQKSQVLRSIMEGLKTPHTLANFLLTLLKAGRFEALPDIVQGFRALVNESRNTLEAEVETAMPLSETSQKRLADHLEKLLGKKLSLVVKVYPELMAGLRVRVGGRTLDFTFSSQISQMERWLTQGQA